jgi:hypothetical protein
MPSAARHDVTISWRGVLIGTRLTALSDFSFQLSNTYEALNSNNLVNKVASFNVVYIIDLFDQVLLLFSPCKYQAIYRSSLRAHSFPLFSLSNMPKTVQFAIL